MISRRLPSVVLALLLGLVLQPTLAAACDVHDLVHRLATGHGHDEPGHPNDHQNPQPHDEASDPWADVFHVGHCCAPVSTIVAVPLLWLAAQSASTLPDRHDRAREPPALAAWLRPPIV